MSAGSTSAVRSTWTTILRSARGHRLRLDAGRPATHPDIDLAARGSKSSADSSILVGMYDYGGLDQDSFQVVASFPVDDVPAGQNLARRFRPTTEGVWELRLKEPVRVTQRQAHGVREGSAGERDAHRADVLDGRGGPALTCRMCSVRPSLQLSVDIYVSV